MQKLKKRYENTVPCIVSVISAINTKEPKNAYRQQNNHK